MEQKNQGRKLSLKFYKQQFKREKKQLKFTTIQSDKSIQTLSNQRPTTGRRRQLKKTIKCRSIREVMQFEDFFQQSIKQSEIQQVYYSKKLNLSQNSLVFDEDALKLQNLITGGYCYDEEFMSISRFNKSKDNFILLNEIYERAKVHPRSQEFSKQPLKSRNIFSIIYLNQNLKKMGKKQTNTIFQRLKIVR